MLSARDIYVSYNKSSSGNELDGVTISIVPGQITAIVGPNGSGKSTLIRSLSRILEPSSGQILLNGEDLYQDITSRFSSQAISVAPQETHIAFEFNAREVVAMGRMPRQAGWALFSGETAADRKAVDEALARADISAEQASRPVMTLSGGERQRVLIARAIVQDTDIILLDEPTSSLDLAHQSALFAQLKSLAAVENKAIVIVLHDLSQAAAFADRLVMLSAGVVAADGPVDEVLTRELIWQVYQSDVRISVDIATGRKVVSNLPKTPENPLAGMPLYLICGGGGGAELMRTLRTVGASLAIDFLREGDIDRLTAVALGIPFLPARAFESVPMLDHQRIDEIQRDYGTAVFAPSSIGISNISSLMTAIRLAKRGLAVYAMKSSLLCGEDPSNIGQELVLARSELEALLTVPALSDAGELTALLGLRENA